MPTGDFSSLCRACRLLKNLLVLFWLMFVYFLFAVLVQVSPFQATILEENTILKATEVQFQPKPVVSNEAKVITPWRLTSQANIITWNTDVKCP